MDFAQKLDGAASLALDSIKIGRDLTQEELNAWCSFIMSLWMRTPEDISTLKLAYREAWERESKDIQEKYSQIRNEADPKSVIDFHNQQKPGWFEHSLLEMGTKLMTHTDIGILLSALHLWDYLWDCTAYQHLTY